MKKKRGGEGFLTCYRLSRKYFGERNIRYEIHLSLSREDFAIHN